jgi:hypothetical protein
LSDLIELLDASRTDYDGSEVSYVYEIYEGDWVELYTSSANPYWHTRDSWIKNHSDATPVREAKILVMSDGGLIGYWKTKELFYDFLEIYLRATIVEKMTQ